MDFSPDISQTVDTLSKKCNEKKKVILDFIGLLKARAELEEYYSRSLEKLGIKCLNVAESLTKLIHGNKDSMKDLFIILRNYFHIQTEQTRTFARQIKNDIITELDRSLQVEAAWEKEMTFLKQKHQKEIRRNIDSLNTLRDEYVQAINEEKKFQMNRSIPKKLSYRQCEIKLQNFIAFYNQYIESYFQDIAVVQDRFSQIELERRKNLQDAGMKFFMFEISVIRNLQYDITGISSKIEQYNPQTDLNKLLADEPSDKPLLSKLNFENYKSFIHSQLGFKPDQQPANKKKKPIFDQVVQETTDTLEQKETNQIFMKMFQSAMFNKIISDETINNLTEMLNQSDPLIYIQSLEKVLKLRLHQEEAMSNVIDYEVSPEAYVSLMKLILTLLDFCNKKNDHGLVIIQAFFMSKSIYKLIFLPNQNQQMKMCLSEGLNNHPVFQNSQIWVNYSIQLSTLLIDNTSVFADNSFIQKDVTQTQIREYIEQIKLIGCTQEIIEAVKQQLNYNEEQK